MKMIEKIRELAVLFAVFIGALFLPSCIKYNIPVEQDGKFIKVGK